MRRFEMQQIQGSGYLRRAGRISTVVFLGCAGIVLALWGCSTQAERQRGSQSNRANGNRREPDGGKNSKEITVEGHLRFIMVNDGVSTAGIDVSPPAYFVASDDGSRYMLQFDRGCKLVNADEYRECPGFNQLAEGNAPIAIVGSGPVLEPPRSRVRLRGVVVGDDTMLGGDLAYELRVTHFERLDTSDSAPAITAPRSVGNSVREVHGRISSGKGGPTIAEIIDWLPVKRPGAPLPDPPPKETVEPSVEAVLHPPPKETVEPSVEAVLPDPGPPADHPALPTHGKKQTEPKDFEDPTPPAEYPALPTHGKKQTEPKELGDVKIWNDDPNKFIPGFMTLYLTGWHATDEPGQQYTGSVRTAFNMPFFYTPHAQDARIQGHAISADLKKLIEDSGVVSGLLVRTNTCEYIYSDDGVAMPFGNDWLLPYQGNTLFFGKTKRTAEGKLSFDMESSGRVGALYFRKGEIAITKGEFRVKAGTEAKYKDVVYQFDGRRWKSVAR